MRLLLVSDRFLSKEETEEANKQLLEWNSLFEECGEKVSTEYMEIDRHYNEEDWFLFDGWHESSIPFFLKVLREGYINNTIYLQSEPDVVMPWHTEKALKGKVLKFFHYIITWRTDLPDYNRIYYSTYTTKTRAKEDLDFPYRTYYSEQDKIFHTVEFEKKKLIVNISGNKPSRNKGELYSERRRVIDYFESCHTGDFDLFGTNWEKEHLKNYCGQCESKMDVYQNYRFALCIENQVLPGYITEKIIDCFAAKIVPIYLGAQDVLDFLPSKSFIPYRKFNGLEEMHSFISEMTYSEWMEYINTASDYLESSESDKLTLITRIEAITRIINEHSEKGIFNLSWFRKRLCLYLFPTMYFVRKKAISILVRLRHRFIG